MYLFLLVCVCVCTSSHSYFLFIISFFHFPLKFNLETIHDPWVKLGSSKVALPFYRSNTQRYLARFPICDFFICFASWLLTNCEFWLQIFIMNCVNINCQHSFLHIFVYCYCLSNWQEVTRISFSCNIQRVYFKAPLLKILA